MTRLFRVTLVDPSRVYDAPGPFNLDCIAESHLDACCLALGRYSNHARVVACEVLW